MNDTLAAAIERDRRAALFDDLVAALDGLVGDLLCNGTRAENFAVSVLIRARAQKPTEQKP